MAYKAILGLSEIVVGLLLAIPSFDPQATFARLSADELREDANDRLVPSAGVLQPGPWLTMAASGCRSELGDQPHQRQMGVPGVLLLACRYQPQALAQLPQLDVETSLSSVVCAASSGPGSAAGSPRPRDKVLACRYQFFAGRCERLRQRWLAGWRGR
jgi:hypothetical protein